MWRRCERASGFTLVELLVAAFIVSLCLAGAYHMLQTCLLAKSRGETRLSSMTEVRLFCYDFEKNLKSAVVFEDGAGPFRGEEESIAFFSVGGPDVPGRSPVPSKWVAYRFVTGPGTDSPGRIERREELAGGGEVLSDRGVWETVLRGVEDFSLEYYGRAEGWTERWPRANRPPGAVKLALTAGGDDGAVSCSTIVRVPTGPM
jgi:prepilin-type N-terminal cleavage/methylation domain-containing protein